MFTFKYTMYTAPHLTTFLLYYITNGENTKLYSQNVIIYFSSVYV